MAMKMMKISGGVVSVLLLSSLYIHLRRRRHDQLATQVLQALHRAIAPATTGLMSERALGIHYADDLLKQVNKKVLMLNKKVAIQFAEQIKSAWGAWYQGGDDEAKVYAVFRNLKDKVQVSQVASAYQETYGENLIETLQDRLGNTEIKTVLDIIKPLPDYRSV